MVRLGAAREQSPTAHSSRSLGLPASPWLARTRARPWEALCEGMATSWFVNQPLQSLLHKTLRPLVDKVAADPNRGGNVGDWHPIGQEYNRHSAQRT